MRSHESGSQHNSSWLRLRRLLAHAGTAVLLAGGDVWLREVRGLRTWERL